MLQNANLIKKLQDIYPKCPISVMDRLIEFLRKDVWNFNSQATTEECLLGLLNKYKTNYGTLIFLVQFIIFINTNHSISNKQVQEWTGCSHRTLDVIHKQLREDDVIRKVRTDKKYNRKAHKYEWINSEAKKTFFSESGGLIWQTVFKISTLDYQKAVFKTLTMALATDDKEGILRQITGERNRIKALRMIWLLNTKSVDFNKYKEKVLETLEDQKLKDNDIPLTMEQHVQKDALNKPNSSWDNNEDIDEFFKIHHTDVEYLISDDEVTDVPKDPNLDYTNLDFLPD